MASWQAHLAVLFLKLHVKRRLSRQTDALQARQSLSATAPKLPAAVLGTTGTVGGVSGEWVRPRHGSAAGTLLYLHGGGYFACSPATHRPITSAFARRGLDVFAADYRLAPEHPFPAAIDDAVAAYRGLLDSGTSHQSLAIAGDSAGGGLALATLVSIRDAGLPLPAACVLFSPWTDLAGTGASLQTNNRRDAMFMGSGIGLAAKPYLAGQDPKHPLASPLYADLRGLPPTLIHVGSYEVLLDDSVRLEQRARQAGVAVTLRAWPVVPHVWQLFPLPETAASMGEAADFLLRALPAAPRQLAA